jgi:hypothetical protein
MFVCEADMSISFCWLCSQSMLGLRHIKAEPWPYHDVSTMSNAPCRRLSGEHIAPRIRCRSSFDLLSSCACGKHNTIWYSSNTLDIPGNDDIIFHICAIPMTSLLNEVAMFGGSSTASTVAPKCHWHPALNNTHEIRTK